MKNIELYKKCKQSDFLPIKIQEEFLDECQRVLVAKNNDNGLIYYSVLFTFETENPHTCYVAYVDDEECDACILNNQDIPFYVATYKETETETILFPISDEMWEELDPLIDEIMDRISNIE